MIQLILYTWLFAMMVANVILIFSDGFENTYENHTLLSIIFAPILLFLWPFSGLSKRIKNMKLKKHHLDEEQISKYNQKLPKVYKDIDRFINPPPPSILDNAKSFDPAYENYQSQTGYGMHSHGQVHVVREQVEDPRAPMDLSTAVHQTNQVLELLKDPGILTRQTQSRRTQTRQYPGPQVYRQLNKTPTSDTPITELYRELFR